MGATYGQRVFVYTCPICGKPFDVVLAGEWAYRMHRKNDQTRLLCSWSCLQTARRQAAKENERRKVEREKKRAAKQRALREAIKNDIANDKGRTVGLNG